MQYVRIVFDFLGTYGVIIIIGLIAIIGFILKIRSIMNGNIVEWLIEKVADAEAYFGSNTGQIKLRAVYDVFCKDRPLLSFLISFEKFSRLVDIALEKFEVMLSEDAGIAEWFENLKKEKGNKSKQQSFDLVENINEDIDPDKDVNINIQYEENTEIGFNVNEEGRTTQDLEVIPHIEENIK
jgi:hypothetical protein